MYQVQLFVLFICLLKQSFHIPSFRLELLEHQLSHLEQFDQALLALTQKSEGFLSGLRSSSQVDIADLEAAITKLKVQNQYFFFRNEVLF